MPTHRAIRKKAGRTFKVGDLVTWGTEVSSHRVIAVEAFGVVVDASPEFPRHFVPFERLRKVDA